MRVIVVAAVALLLVVIGASQLALPGIVERQTANRLTERGGEASVSVSAFPAARLLFGDGSRFEVQASGLDLELDVEETEVFDRLDGFDEVDVAIDDSSTGPFALESFSLTRSGRAPYRLTSRGDAVPADVVEFGAGRLGVPEGGLLGDLTGLALGSTPVPFALDMEVASEDGRIVVVSGAGTVAGLPTGPLARLLTAAIVVRL